MKVKVQVDINYHFPSPDIFVDASVVLLGNKWVVLAVNIKTNESRVIKMDRPDYAVCDYMIYNGIVDRERWGIFLSHVVLKDTMDGWTSAF